MRYALAGLVALFALPALAAAPPLPEGAVARLGTTQFRTDASAIRLSPDGKRAALRVGDGIDVMDLDSGEVIARLRDDKAAKHPSLVRGRHDSVSFFFTFAPGGKEIVVASGQPEIWMWNATTGKPLRSFDGPKHDGAARNVFGLFGGQLADFIVVESGAGFQKFDPKTGKWTDISSGGYNISDISPDGRWFTDYTDMASVENYIGVTDTRRNKHVYAGASGGSYPFNSTPSPDGKLVACTTDEAGPEVFRVPSGEAIELRDKNPKLGHGRPKFSPDGKTLIVPLSYDERHPPHFARWDVTTGERLKDWPLPVRFDTWAVDHRNNRLVVVAGQCVFRIDIATGKLHTPPDGFLGYARPAISPDGKRAAAGDAVGAIRVWSAPFTGKPRTLRESGSAVHDLTFSTDGKALFVAHEDRSVSVWNPVSGEQSAVLNAPATELRGRYLMRTSKLAVSPDGKTALLEVETERVWAWDVPSCKVLWERKPEPGDKEGYGITGCRPVFDPDGNAIYYGQPKGEILKLDPRTGKRLEWLIAPVKLKSYVSRLAVSPDGKKLAAHTYFNDGELVLFDIEKGDAIWRQSFKLDDAVGGLCFAPDGSAVITTHADGSIRGWKATDGAPTFQLRGTPGYIGRLQLTSDGTFAITDSPGATALVWKLK
jgi:WD40 repeat protein